MAVKQILVGKAGSSATPITLIKGDSNTQIIEMIVERYYGGVDLTPLAWSVTVENANGASDEYRGIEAIANGTNIAVRWKVTGTATAVVGLTKFKLSGYAQDGSDVLIWQSGDYFIRVNDTFEYVPGAETQAALTEVQKLIIYVDGELNKVIKAGNDAAEAARAANKAADRANSVADGKNEGRITALEQFTTKPGEPYAVEGKFVQLDNFEGMPMNAVTRIEPVQAGSGDPYPGGGGKNLLNPKLVGGNEAYVSVTTDGRWRINNTSGGAIYLANEWVKLPAGNYCFQTDSNAPNLLVYIQKNSDDYSVYISDGIQTKTVYVSDGEQIRVLCVVPAGTSTTVSIWAAKGANSTHYAPYANIRPISGHTGAKLTRCGKNVLSSKLLGGNESYVSVTTDGRWRINNTSGNTIYIDNEWTNLPAGDYCFRTDSAIANMLLYIQKNQDDYSEYISDGIPMRIIHVSNGEKIRILCAVPNGTNATISVWATIDVNPKPFISYQGKTFSASFGQTVYGGTLDWNTGVLTVDRAVYNFTGNEPFSLTSGGIPYFSVTKSAGVIASVARFDQTSAENGSCSHYKSVSAWSGNACEYMGVTHSFRFTDTRFAAVDDFKAYLAAQKTAGTPVQVCCKLATPTTIQLTPAQLTALQGMNNIFCDAGETTVSGRKDILWLTSGLIEQIDTLKKAIVSLGGNV